MAKRTTTGLFWYPEAGDCAACIIGRDHKSQCVGVEWEGSRTYNKSYNWAVSNQQSMIEGVYG